MRTRRFPKLIFVLGLVALLSLALVGTALAFENREGDIVIIDSGEVVADDLYVFARDFTLIGTVQGDLVTFGSQITIGPSGVVEGDLIGAGQSLVINGQVQDDVRIAGGVLVLGPGAQVTDDFISAGFSLETGAGSTVGGDAAFAGNQALLAGNIDGNLHAAANGVDIQGSVGGNVDAGCSPAASLFTFFVHAPAAGSTVPVAPVCRRLIGG
jgi:cytoskeletal protein CcmA (bactofilin family)